MLWTWEKLFRQEMERRDWKAYPNCLKTCPFPHAESRPLKWGRVYKMAVSVDMNPPRKWCALCNITDALAWRWKLAAVMIKGRRRERQDSIKTAPPPRQNTPWMYRQVLIYLHGAKRKHPWAVPPTSSCGSLLLSRHVDFISETTQLPPNDGTTDAPIVLWRASRYNGECWSN